MRQQYLARWESLKGSYWFIPGIMLGLAVLLAPLTLRLDDSARFEWVATVGWLYSGGPGGARDILSTLSGSLITVTGVIFSVVIVALSIGSSQFGPRLLINFLRDSSNQFVLGVLIGTFAYCMLVLRSIRAEDPIFVPYISVNIALLLGLISLVCFVFFIHHAAISVSAESVIEVVSRDLDHAIERLFPTRRRLGSEALAEQHFQRGLPEDLEERQIGVAAERDGYLQTVDYARLLALAEEHDLVLSVLARPGEFVTDSADLLLAYPDERVDDDLSRDLRDNFMVGGQRLGAQDIEFALNQLVELAVRALSHAINDPFTAMSCINRLGAALAELAERSEPDSSMEGAGGRVRVIYRALSYPELVGDAFSLIRQNASGNTAVLTRLMETLVIVAANTRSERDSEAVWQQASMVRRQAEETIREPFDRLRLQQSYVILARLLERDPESWQLVQTADLGR